MHKLNFFFLIRHPTNYSLQLPNCCQKNMAPFDKEWIDRAMFLAKGKLVTALKLWWNPPQIQHEARTPPHPDTYHYRWLLLWAPRMMWNMKFHYPCCGVGESLRSKGL